MTPVEHDCIVLGLNNDSACDADILSVGHFNRAGNVTWIRQVGNYQTNRVVPYPISVRARSMYPVMLIGGRDIPSGNRAFGYCVQLATGRIYVLRGTAPWGAAVKMHAASILSRLSGGRWVLSGINRVRVPPRN